MTSYPDTHRIQTIKAVREVANLGLLEAKSIADRILNGMKKVLIKDFRNNLEDLPRAISTMELAGASVLIE